ncbi:hypothetical protein H112_08639 [Trichophyton rubrum D6]|uniref:Uncharacterized protein n=4 Tax=Trichophyton TaxID=5550 RepID=A0A178EUA8_TRIRU|nr:uncharacterized protein TERG_01192 [Trichophyton rubrum CBS 118892]EZF10103.1 hypothetical protein H100_08661 [Trichophyton rubrum MR850]EZF36908.1 hypothetical protein H102_08620 [Trichophyton rubrum CBS 100081]EZF47542.1 hypothetical protein H103_08643 [Trichophyton rubrum CBS 288.86]EZF58200.1 hypothetical protein H104_08595 [Trichophyton rubrum CBS 289.86]EZF68865.1 hypothetical protein H105_08647 [Trichophyton soudanense CBS 452.61]EZF79542.1 hypothetical protein H110_08645 [Trichophy
MRHSATSPVSGSNPLNGRLGRPIYAVYSAYVCLSVSPYAVVSAAVMSTSVASPKSVRTPQAHARKIHQSGALATGGSVKPALLETAETLVAGVGAGQRLLSCWFPYFQKAVSQGSSSPTNYGHLYADITTGT